MIAGISFDRNYCAGGGFKIWKIDLEGNIVNEVIYRHEDWWMSSAGEMHIIPTQDGYFAIAGELEINETDNTEGFIMKFDAQGDSLWMKSYGGERYDVFKSLIELEDGSFIAGGDTRSMGEFAEEGLERWLVKTDKDGNELWQKAFGQIGHDRLRDLVKNEDGTYALSGTIRIRQQSYKYGAYYAKLDVNFNIIWEKTMYEPDRNACLAVLDKHSESGYYLLTCQDTVPNSLQPKGVMQRVDANGKLIWEKYLGRYAAGEPTPTADGGVLISGNWWPLDGIQDTMYGYFAKFSELGEVEFERFFRHKDNVTFNIFEEVVFTPDGGYLLTGSTNGELNQDMWLVKLDKNACLESDYCDDRADIVSIFEPEPVLYDLQLFPNPSQQNVRIRLDGSHFVDLSLSVWDIQGRLVHQQKMNQKEELIEVIDWVKGMYLVEIRGENQLLLGREKLVVY
ncbi:MAG: T9SS type A sorting domain-containing protein [Chitinophagales bacterium]